MVFQAWKWLALLPALTTPTALAKVHEYLSAVPHGWSAEPSVPGRAPSTFTIALRNEFEGLEEKLLDVSTPGSPNYGKFLTREEVEKLFPPPKDAADKVVAWLRASGIDKYHVDGAFVDFATDVDTANALLKASYRHYRSSSGTGGVTKLRTLQYSIPDDLQDQIAFVDPGTFFGRPRSSPAITPSKTKRTQEDTPTRPTAAASCETSITPSCLKQLYNIGDYKADPDSGSRIGFGSFLNESALYADLAQFEEYFDIPSQNFTKVVIANASNVQDPSYGGYGESNLDVQTIIGVAHPLPVTEFLTGGLP